MSNFYTSFMTRYHSDEIWLYDVMEFGQNLETLEN